MTREEITHAGNTMLCVTGYCPLLLESRTVHNLRSERKMGLTWEEFYS